MGVLCFFKRSFSFRDGQFTLLAFPFARDLFFLTLVLAASPLSFERNVGCDGSFVNGFALWWIFCRGF